MSNDDPSLKRDLQIKYMYYQIRLHDNTRRFKSYSSTLSIDDMRKLLREGRAIKELDKHFHIVEEVNKAELLKHDMDNFKVNDRVIWSIPYARSESSENGKLYISSIDLNNKTLQDDIKDILDPYKYDGDAEYNRLEFEYMMCTYRYRYKLNETLKSNEIKEVFDMYYKHKFDSKESIHIIADLVNEVTAKFNEAKTKLWNELKSMYSSRFKELYNDLVIDIGEIDYQSHVLEKEQMEFEKYKQEEENRLKAQRTAFETFKENEKAILKKHWIEEDMKHQRKVNDFEAERKKLKMEDDEQIKQLKLYVENEESKLYVWKDKLARYDEMVRENTEMSCQIADLEKALEEVTADRDRYKTTVETLMQLRK